MRVTSTAFFLFFFCYGVSVVLTQNCIATSVVATRKVKNHKSKVKIKKVAEIEFIKPCQRSDPQINVCLANSIAHLRNHLIYGIPDLEIPSIDPLKIPRLQMENGHGKIRVKAVFTDITIYGAANHTLTGVRANIDNYVVELSAKAPRLIVTGRYEVLGSVFTFNIRSKGDFQAMFEDAAGLAKLHGKEIFVDRIKYLNIDKVGVDYKIGRARFRIRDQGTGSKILSEAINNFLNHNWREVLEEMKHTASSAIEKYVKQIVNKALLKIPVDLWLLEETGDRIPVTLKK